MKAKAYTVTYTGDEFVQVLQALEDREAKLREFANTSADEDSRLFWKQRLETLIGAREKAGAA